MLITCKECGKEMSSQAAVCMNCGAILPRRCPRCFQFTYVGKTDIIYCPEVTKTKVRMNLNPLRPFTFATAETKVVSPERYQEIFRGTCKNCNYPGFDSRKGSPVKRDTILFTLTMVGLILYLCIYVLIHY